MGLGEAGLVAAITCHALNGIGIILVDFWAKGPKHQRLMLCIVIGLFVVTATTSVPAPRSPRARTNRRTTRGNAELDGWISMRASEIERAMITRALRCSGPQVGPPSTPPRAARSARSG